MAISSPIGPSPKKNHAGAQNSPNGLILLRSHVRRNPPKPNRLGQKQHKKQRPRFRHPTTSPNHHPHQPTRCSYSLPLLLPLSLAITTLPSLLPPPVIPASAMPGPSSNRRNPPKPQPPPQHPTIGPAFRQQPPRPTTTPNSLPCASTPSPPPPSHCSLLSPHSFLPPPHSFLPPRILPPQPPRPPTHPLPLRPIHWLTARPRSPTRPALPRPRPPPARRNHARRRRQRPHRRGRP